jgi:ketosteroid isomerase-like protein
MTDSDEVRRTLHTYCRLLDERDLDTLLREVYTADAVDDRRRGEPLRGPDQIKGYFARSFERIAATVHMISNADVTIDGDRASAYSRVTAYHWLFGGDPVRPADFVLLGSYDDELVRTPDGWRIARRTVGALGPAGLAQGELPEVFRGFGGKARSPANT